MDMMFNTERIVKDMKGGEEDMTEKRFVYYEHKGADYILENPNTDLDFIEMLGDCLEAEEIVNRLNGLYEENKELKQYKQSVNDVLRSWSQKNLTAKQLQVVLAIMEELNVIGDVE